MSYYLIRVDENGNPHLIGPLASEAERIAMVVRKSTELGPVFWLNISRDHIECGKFEILKVDL